MTDRQRRRIRTRAAAALTTLTLALLLTGITHPGHLTRLLLAVTALLGTITAVIALASTFARTPATRTAARCTLDLLLRLVPWYTPRN
ncbi:hypothetical protein [Streptomyces sp. KL2]|uniref:hypothetical protein n=1 Tax=Streptomyces sp. KL2 TaxID=3050126 RepID=UPI00397C4F33